MTLEQWTAVDAYFEDTFIPPDAALEAALNASDAAGLPALHVAPNQGKLLMLLAMSLGAKTILEIGTLAGYSTIWLARALPPTGHLLTLELNAAYADVARANLLRAGVMDRVEVRIGAALEALDQLVAEAHPPFDFIFIDADKQNNAAYFERALQLARPGSVIVVDNVVRAGRVVDAASDDPSVQGVRCFNARVAAESRVLATAIQTVGSKGYDGFALLLVLA